MIVPSERTGVYQALCRERGEQLGHRADLVHGIAAGQGFRRAVGLEVPLPVLLHHHRECGDAPFLHGLAGHLIHLRLQVVTVLQVPGLVHHVGQTAHRQQHQHPEGDAHDLQRFHGAETTGRKGMPGGRSHEWTGEWTFGPCPLVRKKSEVS